MSPRLEGSLARFSRARKWEFRIGKKAAIIERFSVPINKLDGKALQYFLRAAVCRYDCSTIQESLEYFVNERPGKPQRSPYSKIYRVLDLQRGVSGYFCGTWDCYAEATFSLSDTEIKGLRKIISQNKY